MTTSHLKVHHKKHPSKKNRAVFLLVGVAILLVGALVIWGALQMKADEKTNSETIPSVSPVSTALSTPTSTPIISPEAANTIPSDAQIQLAKATITQFFDDAKKNDFSKTYQSLDAKAKMQVVLEKFSESFQNFTPGAKYDSKKFDGASIVVNSAQEKQTSLSLTGEVKKDTQKLVFELYYLREAQDWALAGLSFRE